MEDKTVVVVVASYRSVSGNPVRFKALHIRWPATVTATANYSQHRPKYSQQQQITHSTDQNVHNANQEIHSESK